MRKLFTVVLLLSCVCGQANAYGPEVKERAAKILSKMNLEQKCTIISGLTCKDDFNPINTLAGCPELGVPNTYMADGPQGINNKVNRSEPGTWYACGVSAAASFDREAILGMGDGLGIDARARGVGFLLGPGANLYRTALCGRNFEYFGEDPYLAGEIAVCYIKGVQQHGVIATIKHFAANNQEWDRFVTTSNIDERTLNEIYFPAFRKAVQEAKVGAIMTACGKLNGLPCAENPYLLKQTLRKDWGYEGITMCDWQTIYSTLNGIQSGLDVEMPNPLTHDYERVKRLVDNGVVREAEIDEKCLHVLETLIAFGLLDRPHKDTSLPLDNPYCHQKAYAAAVGGPVLVKNNGILPIAPSKKNRILLCGPFTDKEAKGGGSGWVRPVEGAYVTTERAFSQLGKGYTFVNEPVPSDEQIKSATAVLVEVGLGHRIEGENRDHGFGLPEEQEALIEKLVGLSDKVIVVVHSGCEVDMRPWHDKAAAILYAWYGGEHTGRVITEIVTGKVSPSGRLPFTMWGSFENNPASETYYADKFISYQNRPRFDQNPHCDYKEGVFIGYRGIEKFQRTPLYPFGYGLSYTTFEFSDLALLPEGDGFRVELNVKNTGKREAAQVVQLYVAPKNPSLPRPVRELKQFCKLQLKPGMTQRVSMLLPRLAFAHYDVVAHDWAVDNGAYAIQIGDNEQHILLEQSVEL